MFLRFLVCLPGAEVLGKMWGGGDRGGQACLWRGWAGRKDPQWKAVPLSAGCSDSGLSLVDVEVSEVVEGRTKGPARLHVVYLLGQLESKITVGSPLPPHSGHMFPPMLKIPQLGLVKHVRDGHFLTCNTVLSLKPKPSFSRQVMYVMSMQRKGLMARYLVILLHTANTDSHRCPKSGFWHMHHIKNRKHPFQLMCDVIRRWFVPLCKQGGVRRRAEGQCKATGGWRWRQIGGMQLSGALPPGPDRDPQRRCHLGPSQAPSSRPKGLT